MPIYEYKCTNCDNSFELIRSINDEDKNLKCPECSSSEVQKILSIFASSPSQSCSSCAPSGQGFT